MVQCAGICTGNADMDKRMIENRRVKQSLARALLLLMSEKNFSEITVSELVRQAGVGRQSYYRNFNTKEEIIVEYLYEIQADTAQELKKQGIIFCDRRFVAVVMEGLRRHREEVLTLHHAGFSYMILDMINQYIGLIGGDMPISSVQKYKLSCMAGAIYNTEIMWLEGGAAEDCHAVADIICGFRADAILAEDIRMPEMEMRNE